MRWLLAGLLFALAVALAIGTAALRADNARWRYHVEVAYRDVWDRHVEHVRLSVERLKEATPERLAAANWAQLHREQRRTEAGVQ
jgi:hypothetical protein